jgi:protoporphyrinogen oxidase
VPDAYVLYDADYRGARGAVLDFLEHAGILTAGRYGRWEYSSMEDAILAGREAAGRLAAVR